MTTEYINIIIELKIGLSNLESVFWNVLLSEKIEWILHTWISHCKFIFIKRLSARLNFQSFKVISANLFMLGCCIFFHFTNWCLYYSLEIQKGKYIVSTPVNNTCLYPTLEVCVNDCLEQYMLSSSVWRYGWKFKKRWLKHQKSFVW